MPAVPCLRSLALALSCGLAWASAAAAQETDLARAERLFAEGRAARDQGDHATACAKFGESLAIVERASSLINVASCEEKAGRLGAASRHTTAALGMLPAGDERILIAREMLDRLAQRTPRVTVKTSPGLPPGAQVIVDGTGVDPAALAAPIPLDPGEHVLALRIAGHADRVTRVTLAEGQRVDVALAAGAPEPPAASPAGAGRDERASSSGGLRTIGWILGGVGVASLGVGIVTGVLTMGKRDAVEEQCPGGRCRSQEGVDAAEAGRTLSLVSTITFGVGVAGLGAGAVLIVVSPSPESAHGAGLRVVGSF